MTLFPFEEKHKVSGAAGRAYIVPQICAHPSCTETLIQRHHLCRRSALGGPFAWIEYEGVLIQNMVGLCLEHHNLITDDKARIVWVPLGFFVWVDELNRGKLDPHPVIDDGSQNGDVKLEHEEFQPDVCPTCKRPHRRPHSHEQKRVRGKWSIHIPMDERERGADVLDTLLEEARKLMAKAGLPYGDEDNARYFILAAVLGLFVQHAEEVMSDS